MIEKWDITIPELTGEEIRRAWIYLPESYTQNPKRRYPVLYMFDGHNVFYDTEATYGKSWGMKEYLEQTGAQVLVAAVESNRSPDDSRLSEYSPFDFTMRHFFGAKKPEQAVFIQGRGQLTMDWLVRDFKPYIDLNYRTLPEREHTFIVGSSMGGLMSIYAVLHYNDVFSRAAALSPSLWMDAEASREMIASSHPAPDTVLYMDYGTEEWRNRKQLLQAFGGMCSCLVEKEVLLTARIVPGGRHCEASWEKQIPIFMNALLN